MSRRLRRPELPVEDFPVSVNVYDLLGGPGATLVQAITSCGCYHSGVEVGGVEYSYGAVMENPSGEPLPADLTGMWSQKPRQLPADFALSSARFREAIQVGTLRCTRIELRRKIKALELEWLAADYDVLRRNCNHFAARACEVFETKAPPAWVNQLAEKGDELSAVIGRLSKPWINSCVSSSGNRAPASMRRTPTAPAGMIGREQFQLFVHVPPMDSAGKRRNSSPGATATALKQASAHAAAPTSSATISSL